MKYDGFNKAPIDTTARRLAQAIIDDTHKIIAENEAQMDQIEREGKKELRRTVIICSVIMLMILVISFFVFNIP